MTVHQHYQHDMAPEEMVERLGRPDPVIIECGCHDGRDTAQFLKAFPECSLTGFEPDPRPLHRHAPAAPGFFDLVPPDPRVTLYQMAVGDSHRTTPLFRSSGTPPGGKWNTNDWDHSSSICRPTGHRSTHVWCTFPPEIVILVPVVPVDSISVCLPRVDFVWADIQGAEALMIQGAPHTLRRTRWLYTEYDDVEQYEGQPDLNAICRLVAPLGMHLVATYNKNALFHNAGAQ